MGDPIAAIQIVGNVESFHDAFHAGWPVHPQAFPAALDPGIQVHVRQAGDVVRMKVSDQHAVQATHGQLSLGHAQG